MRHDPRTLVQVYFERILGSGDLSAVEDIVGPAFHEHALEPFGREEPGLVDGPTHVKSVAEWLHATFPDLTMNVEITAVDGDVVAVRVLGEGTQLGPLGPLPPSGRRFSARSTHWFKIVDGRLAEHWADRDDLTTMLQLGIVSSPARMG